jgi:hypothetical protein
MLRRRERRYRAQQEEQRQAQFLAQTEAQAAAAAAFAAQGPIVIPVVIVQPNGEMQLAEECKCSKIDQAAEAVDDTSSHKPRDAATLV